MSTVTLDERLHAEAVKAAIAVELGPHVYDYGKVPGDKDNPDETERNKPLPSIFAVVAIERRYNPNLNLAAKATRTGWRLSVRGVGRTVNEARWALLKASDALNEKRLTIDGTTTTPVQFESGRAPAPDDGRVSGEAFYVYAH